MQALRISINTIMFSILFLVPLSCKESRGDEKLDAAVQLLIDYSNDQNYKGVWGMFSQNLMRGNDFDEGRYIREREEAGLHSTAIIVREVRVSKKTAKVTVAVDYVYRDNQLIGTAVEEWIFVKDGDAWLFDNYKTVSEP
jgi:hypothetical protein